MRWIVFIVLAFFLFGCKEEIVHNLREAEVNKLITRLYEVQIESEKVKQADGNWALAVNESDAMRAISFLNDTRLVRPKGQSRTQSSSVVSSREDQRFQYERALSTEIERTLSTLDGVLEARVHLNLPPTDPIFGQPVRGIAGSASVLLVTEEQMSLERNAIAALVSGASGVDVQSISVLLSPARNMRKSQPGGIVAHTRANDVINNGLDPSDKLSDEQRTEVANVRDSKLFLVFSAGILLLIGIAIIWFAVRKRAARLHSGTHLARQLQAVTAGS